MSEKEKQRFHEMAEQDKRRFDLEMQNYVPPKDIKVRGRKRQQMKDPNAPKRSLWVMVMSFSLNHSFMYQNLFPFCIFLAQSDGERTLFPFRTVLYVCGLVILVHSINSLKNLFLFTFPNFVLLRYWIELLSYGEKLSGK